MTLEFVSRLAAVSLLVSVALVVGVETARADTPNPATDAGAIEAGPDEGTPAIPQDGGTAIPQDGGPSGAGAAPPGVAPPPAAIATDGGGATPASVDAQDAGGLDDAGSISTSELGTITITAQRRTNTVQKTPIAITAFSQDAIQQQKISTFRDISGRVPGLLAPLTSTALTTQTYSMRGIGEIDTYPEPSVAVYVDDVYLARTVGSIYDTPDLERVEVLRGPQGTLYGRNSAAGAIRFITKDPTSENSLTLSTTLGNYENVDVRARANVAILPHDELDASVTVVRHQRQGYTWDVPLSQWVNNMDIWVARTKVKSRITDRFTATLSGDAMWDRSDASYYTPVNQPNGVPSGNPTNPSLSWVNRVPDNHTTVFGGSLTFKYELTDELSLKLVSAVRGMYGPIYYDNSGTTFIKGDSFAGFNENYETEELTINGDYDRLKFVGGFYYFNEYFHNNRLNQAADSKLNDVGIIQWLDSSLYTKSYAVFGQGDIKIIDGLSATVGARFTADVRSFDNVGYQAVGVPLVYPIPSYANNAQFGSLFGPGSTNFDAQAPTKTFASFTPKLGVQYQITPDILGYASFSEGFKSGGYDLRASTLEGSITPYQPETIYAYEAGFKSAVLNNHVTANLAVFYNHINGLQERATEVGALGTPVNALINTGNAHTDGGELELAVNPFKGLTIGGSGAYLQTAYDTFTATLPPNVDGRTTLLGLALPLAPTWQTNGNFNYRIPLPTPGTWRIGGDVPYESGHYLDIYNTPQLHVRAQAFVNGTINYTSEEERWSTGISATNLANLRRPQSGGYAPENAGQNPLWYYAYNPPRFINVFFNIKL
jgi:iron complex outermembrane receptor protein